MIDSIVPQYRQILESASSLDTIKKLGLRYDQNHEINGAVASEDEEG